MMKAFSQNMWWREIAFPGIRNVRILRSNSPTAVEKDDRYYSVTAPLTVCTPRPLRSASFVFCILHAASVLLAFCRQRALGPGAAPDVGRQGGDPSGGPVHLGERDQIRGDRPAGADGVRSGL